MHPLLLNCSQGAVRRKAYGGGSPRRRRTRQVMVWLSRIEQQPSKLSVGGSNPPTIANAGLAQLVERLPCKQDVSGSSPLIGTNTTGKGILRRRRSPCLAEGSNPYEVPLPL